MKSWKPSKVEPISFLCNPTKFTGNGGCNRFGEYMLLEAEIEIQHRLGKKAYAKA
ncbi:MAG: hypothetical protein IPP40_13130 [bacterium]|nr:hypothetical protein [bacterium]